MNPPVIDLPSVAQEESLNLGIPENLAFDDEPLEPLLAGSEPPAPTPASVLQLWERRLDRSEPCARALATVLARNPDLIGQITDLDGAEQCLRKSLDAGTTGSAQKRASCLGAIGRMLEVKGRTDEAEAFYREALGLVDKTTPTGIDLAISVGGRLIHLLEKSNRNDEARNLRNELQAGSLLDREDDASLSNLRETALQMFRSGQYAEAEAIYRRLLAKRWELGSIHCHLAPVLLMTDREAEAREEVDRAWSLRHVSAAYVLVRTQFLRVLLQILSGTDWQSGLRELSKLLSEPGAHMDWKMQPVLDHLKPRLGQERFKMMTAVLAAICNRSRRVELEANPLWKSICGGEESGNPPTTNETPVSIPSAPHETDPEQAEVEESNKFTFGTVVAVDGEWLTVKEYDFAADADVEREYRLTAETEFGNIPKADELQPGDDVVVDYTESCGGRRIIPLVKEVCPVP